MAKAPKVGSRSPWGTVDYVNVIETGKIWSVGTSSHGGLKVSRSAQMEIPQKARSKGGWYEEDAEWSIVALVFPEFFKPSDVDSAHETARNYLPGIYRFLTGIEVTPQTSSALAAKRFEMNHRKDWVVIAAFGDWHKSVPPGMVGGIAVLGGKRTPGAEERYFIIGKNRYEDRNRFGYVVDDALDIEVGKF